MDIQATKIDLIHWLAELKDIDILEQLNVIKCGEDWWLGISEDERLAIDEGLKQLDEGDGIPHEEVVKKVRQKYNL